MLISYGNDSNFSKSLRNSKPQEETFAIYCTLSSSYCIMLQLLYSTTFALRLPFGLEHAHAENRKIIANKPAATQLKYLPLSRGISKINILYITSHILTGLLISYSNCTPRFIESSMNLGLGISIHTYVFYRFIFYVLVRHCTYPLIKWVEHHSHVDL